MKNRKIHDDFYQYSNAYNRSDDVFKNTIHTLLDEAKCRGIGVNYSGHKMVFYIHDNEPIKIKYESMPPHITASYRQGVTPHLCELPTT